MTPTEIVPDSFYWMKRPNDPEPVKVRVLNRHVFEGKGFRCVQWEWDRDGKKKERNFSYVEDHNLTLIDDKDLTPLDMTYNKKFHPNAALRRSGCNSSYFDTTALDQRLRENDKLGFDDLSSSMTWGYIKKAVLGDEWLNDDIILAVIQCLIVKFDGITITSTQNQIQQHFAKKQTKQRTCIVISSLTYASSNRPPEEGQPERGSFLSPRSGRISKTPILNLDITCVDDILIPINCGNAHWVMGRINITDKETQIYDSYNQEREAKFIELKNYRTKIFREKLENIDKLCKPDGTLLSEEDKSKLRVTLSALEHDNMWRRNLQKLPPQKDNVSCGIFVCMYMAYIISGKQDFIDEVNMDNMTKFREWIVKLLCEYEAPVT